MPFLVAAAMPLPAMFSSSMSTMFSNSNAFFNLYQQQLFLKHSSNSAFVNHL